MASIAAELNCCTIQLAKQRGLHILRLFQYHVTAIIILFNVSDHIKFVHYNKFYFPLRPVLDTVVVIIRVVLNFHFHDKAKHKVISSKATRPMDLCL